MKQIHGSIVKALVIMFCLVVAKSFTYFSPRFVASTVPKQRQFEVLQGYRSSLRLLPREFLQSYGRAPGLSQVKRSKTSLDNFREAVIYDFSQGNPPIDVHSFHYVAVVNTGEGASEWEKAHTPKPGTFARFYAGSKSLMLTNVSGTANVPDDLKASIIAREIVRGHRTSGVRVMVGNTSSGEAPEASEVAAFNQQFEILRQMKGYAWGVAVRDMTRMARLLRKELGRDPLLKDMATAYGSTDVQSRRLQAAYGLGDLAENNPAMAQRWRTCYFQHLYLAALFRLISLDNASLRSTISRKHAVLTCWSDSIGSR